ncbi:hypothetical protein [Caldanaerobius fijiensis]|uniref:hypothetical protein n=1 Tax=Caldanaerobius fijiensis TaxID=456330 RepID=UPI0011601B5A|nr:hypothetical protein [Caldanaerobius fijiensis]
MKSLYLRVLLPFCEFIIDDVVVKYKSLLTYPLKLWYINKAIARGARGQKSREIPLDKETKRW